MKSTDFNKIFIHIRHFDLAIYFIILKNIIIVHRPVPKKIVIPTAGRNLVVLNSGNIAQLR
jgi:hypothetical protein